MELKDLPNLTFLDADVDELTESARQKIKEILGREIGKADPLMLFTKSLLSIIVQQRILVDELCRQNLLAYATKKNLDHLGILVGVERLAATAATCTVELKLSAARDKATTILKGTRVTAGDSINFAIDEAVIFPVGETTAQVKATCVEVGEVGNNYAVGELKNIVDPQPFLESIVNVTATAGGSDIEDDDSLRERIHQAPEKFSNAGSKGAYEYWAKTASNLVSDVYVESENPGEVSVYVLLDNGEIPNDEMLSTVDNVLNDKKIRPLTDKVLIKPPDVVKYEVAVKYFIARSSAVSAVTIQQRCDAAVEEFVSWQKANLGRDINPTELVYRMKAAGAKRVEVTAPDFEVLLPNAVAIAENISVEYCGIEED